MSLPLKTSLLYHAAPGHPHWDWLVADPSQPRSAAASLVTWRVMHHWRDWGRVGQLFAEQLPPHRRRYLTWQGELSQHRGWVRQDGRGNAEVQIWTPEKFLLTLDLHSGVILMTGRRIHGVRWGFTVSNC